MLGINDTYFPLWSAPDISNIFKIVSFSKLFNLLALREKESQNTEFSCLVCSSAAWTNVF